MTGDVALCTDSSAQLPAALVAGLDLQVVPVGIALDGEPYDELEVDADRLGVDLFYARLASGARATTSPPSPGQFADAYAAAAARGAREVLSIHVGSEISGTIGSAELAAREAPLPVTVIDTGTASFGVGVCVLAAADAVAAGVSASRVAALIERLGSTLGNVFVAGAAPGGRVPAHDGLPLFSLAGGQTTRLGSAASLEAAAELMASHVLSQNGPLRAAVGHAAPITAPAADALARALGDSDRVVELMRYRVGPSVGAHTGPLSFGAFWWHDVR